MTFRQAKSSEKPHPFGWNTSTTTPSTYCFPKKWLCSKHRVCVFCCWFGFLLVFVRLFVSVFLLGLFFYSFTCFCSAEVLLSQVSMFHQNSWFTPMPKTRAFWAMPCETVCLTNMQQPFEAGQRHVGNYHALTGNECNYWGNINSAKQDLFPGFSGVTLCSLVTGSSQACTMALLTAKITYK